MLNSSKQKMILTALTMMIFFLITGFMEAADARTKGGGRSFKKAPAASKPAPQAQAPQAVGSPMGGSFTRGLAGGIMGGVLGGMLFGGMAHGMGAGGIGGSGIGLFEILILSGLGYFIYRWFSRRNALAGNAGSALRNVELMAAGVQDHKTFVTVRFTANLLDYTVDERSGAVIKGDAENSVKFEESWTFATPVGRRAWKLEGIES